MGHEKPFFYLKHYEQSNNPTLRVLSKHPWSSVRLEALPIALGSLFRAWAAPGEEPFDSQNLPWHSPSSSFLSLVTESRGQHFSSAPHEEALWCWEVSPQSFLQTEQTKASQLLGFPFQTLHHLHSLLWSLSSSSVPFIVTLGLKVESPRATLTVSFAFTLPWHRKVPIFHFCWVAAEFQQEEKGWSLSLWLCYGWEERWDCPCASSVDVCWF